MQVNREQVNNRERQDRGGDKTQIETKAHDSVNKTKDSSAQEVVNPVEVLGKCCTMRLGRKGELRDIQSEVADAYYRTVQ